MTPIEHNGQAYRVVRESDVQRDGILLELWSAKHPEKQLCEVFYSDITHNRSCLLNSLKIRQLMERPFLSLTRPLA